jgi:short-subunit dehydrogenase
VSPEQYGPWAVIAGGSEGVGAAFARKLAADGINVVLLARKMQPLEELSEEIRRTSKVMVRTASMDLSAASVMDQVKELTRDIETGLIIYNAGAESVTRDFLDRDLAESERMAALNVLCPMRFCHRFGSKMRERQRGGIILVSSTGCWAGGPRLALYTATKAFETIFAEALWYELKPYNVNVLALVLGTTDTPAIRRRGRRLDVPGFEAADASAVAQEGLDHLAAGPVWHAGGTEATAQRLRAMAPAEAVMLVGEASKALSQSA